MSNIDQSISSLIELDEFIDIVDIGANPIDGLPPYKPLLEKNLARVIGFEPNEVQSKETIESMKSIMGIIPAFGVALSFVIIYFYPIDSKKHKELLKKLNNKEV